MSQKSLFMIPLVTSLLFSAAPAFAQNFSNWEANQQNQLNQDAASGMLNTNQVQNLQNRESQIQAQQQAYMSQNGGALTQGQSRQIGQELANLNKHMNRDLSRNTGSGVMQQPYYNSTGVVQQPYYTNTAYTNNGYAPWRSLTNGIQQPVSSNGNWGYRHNWQHHNWH